MQCFFLYLAISLIRVPLTTHFMGLPHLPSGNFCRCISSKVFHNVSFYDIKILWLLDQALVQPPIPHLFDTHPLKSRTPAQAYDRILSVAQYLPRFLLVMLIDGLRNNPGVNMSDGRWSRMNSPVCGDAVCATLLQGLKLPMLF